MKKKHRDIVVDGVQYGWTVDNYYELRIWKDKKVIASYTINEHHDAVTPKLVAALIKDPKALEWINAKPCPFCGGEIQHHPKVEWQQQYFVCYHSETCWMNDDKPPYNFTLIPIKALERWNQRL